MWVRKLKEQIGGIWSVTIRGIYLFMINDLQIESEADYITPAKENRDQMAQSTMTETPLN
jgi:hypothetical protein